MSRGKYIPDADIATVKLAEAANFLRNVAGNADTTFTLASGQKLRLSGSPSFDNDLDLVPKSFVLSLFNNLDPKASVYAASQSEVSNFPASVTDLDMAGAFGDIGGTDAGELGDGSTFRVLLKNQSTGSQNGLYTVVRNDADDWTFIRTTDADADEEVTAGLTVFIENGQHANQRWSLQAKSGGGAYTVGTDALTFVQTDVLAITAGDATISISGKSISVGTIGDSNVSSITAAKISIADSGDHFTATTVEAALAEIMTNLASNSNGLGASLIGIEDANGYFTAADVEAALDELYEAIQAVTGGAPANTDKNLTCQVTSSQGDAVIDGGWSGLAAASSGYVVVHLRGYGDLVVSDGDKTGHVYWSSDAGSTALANDDIAQGAKLYRGGLSLGFEFDTNDKIDIDATVSA